MDPRQQHQQRGRGGYHHNNSSRPQHYNNNNSNYNNNYRKRGRSPSSRAHQQPKKQPEDAPIVSLYNSSGNGNVSSTSNPELFESQITQLVQDSYAQVPLENSGKDRSSSNIINIRENNNWVKSVLLKEFCKAVVSPDNYNNNNNNSHHGSSTPANVLDFCCGKCGDLGKFEHCHIGTYIGADITLESLKEGQRRYLNSHAHFDAMFIHADCFAVRTV